VTPNQATYHAHLAHRNLPHGERPTEKHVWVYRHLARYSHNAPSQIRLARLAGVCVKTVYNALMRFRWLGMVTWSAEFITLPSGLRRQRPNRYRFLATFLLLQRNPPGRSKILNPDSVVGKLPKERERTVSEQLALLGYGPKSHRGAPLRPVDPVRTVAEQLAALGFSADGKPLAA